MLRIHRFCTIFLLSFVPRSFQFEATPHVDVITSRQKVYLEKNDSCNKNTNCSKDEMYKRVVSVTKSNPMKKLHVTAFPQFFDVREKFGGRCPGVYKVVNQGQCRGGWAVAVSSVISDRICISSHGKTQQMLSAQHLLSCCRECCGCNGGIVLKAWDWVMDNGLVTGSVYGDKKSCFPYKIPPARPGHYGHPGYGGEWSTINSALPECPPTCADGNQRITATIDGYELWPRVDQFGIMESLMKSGPLQVSMHLYQDFRFYKEGIYVHKYGAFEGDHAVKLIGWGTWKSKDYWLALNSFGNTSWGQKGTFWIPRDGTDNAEFGYAIVSPVLYTDKATNIHNSMLKIIQLFLLIVLVFLI